MVCRNPRVGRGAPVSRATAWTAMHRRSSSQSPRRSGRACQCAPTGRPRGSVLGSQSPRRSGRACQVVRVCEVAVASVMSQSPRRSGRACQFQISALKASHELQVAIPASVGARLSVGYLVSALICEVWVAIPASVGARLSGDGVGAPADRHVASQSPRRSGRACQSRGCARAGCFFHKGRNPRVGRGAPVSWAVYDVLLAPMLESQSPRRSGRACQVGMSVYDADSIRECRNPRVGRGAPVRRRRTAASTARSCRRNPRVGRGAPVSGQGTNRWTNS